MVEKTSLGESIEDGHGRSLLSVTDVAENYLNCSPRHIRRLVDSGRMPRPIKLGALSRFQRSVIEKWIEDGCPDVRRKKWSAR
ncbi:hypothetical protein RISK_002515 [Rhodopirellula islandica]|uniref:Helix-turn-helix domain-containing protein n=1 Tax=Rhodopirellula islandica TaxID=595434 RepID=A0A0J1BH83_RHOIS|nr:hypothetical protein RISK_002515 [Rhodopirellula islandica]